MSPGRHDRTWPLAAALFASAAASLGLTVVYALGGQPQLEGALLGVSLGGLAIAVTLFATRLLPTGGAVEPRDVVPEQVAERPAAERAFAAGSEQIGRRRLLGRALTAAVAALALAALFPLRSLGVRPGRALSETAWRPGRRLVTETGDRLRPEDVEVDSVVTVFPEGHVPAADAQTLLIRLPAEVTPAGPADWHVDGIIAFSKICTHAGCPVGLYQADAAELVCPCHQSTFAVARGGVPTFGPATRPLPQLPLAVDDAGYLAARGDFPEPVGPGFWTRGRA